MNIDYHLYAITDSTNLDENQFLHIVDKLCEGGAGIVQLREKDKTTKEYLELGQKVKQITDTYNIPLIIDDRIDVALALECGVHLGAEDMPISIARKIMGKDAIIGATAKSVEAAIQAEKEGANYLGVGAIYPTTTHVKTKLTSVKTLRDIVDHVTIPVCAIGGLNATNLDILQGVPIQGICCVSALMKAKDPLQATQTLLSLSKQMFQ